MQENDELVRRFNNRTTGYTKILRGFVGQVANWTILIRLNYGGKQCLQKIQM